MHAHEERPVLDRALFALSDRVAILTVEAARGEGRRKVFEGPDPGRFCFNPSAFAGTPIGAVKELRSQEAKG